MGRWAPPQTKRGSKGQYSQVPLRAPEAPWETWAQWLLSWYHCHKHFQDTSPIFSEFREKMQFCGPVLVPSAQLPHGLFSRGLVVPICRVYGKFPGTCETRTTSSTLLFSYGGTVNQMIRLFKTKENPKNILIFYRAISIKRIIPNWEGTHLEGTHKSTTISVQWH